MDIDDALIETVMNLIDEFMDYDEIAEKLGIDIEVVTQIVDMETVRVNPDNYNEDDERLMEGEDFE